jgi:hypothetical protein
VTSSLQDLMTKMNRPVRVCDAVHSGSEFGGTSVTRDDADREPQAPCLRTAGAHQFSLCTFSFRPSAKFMQPSDSSVRATWHTVYMLILQTFCLSNESTRAKAISAISILSVMSLPYASF